MAQSRIAGDEGLVYPVRRDLEKADEDFDAWTYTTPIDGVETTIAIGQPSDTYLAEHGVIVYPVYRVDGDRVSEQLGVYEVRDEQVPAVLDDDGSVNPARLPPPVLYPREPPAAPTASGAAKPAKESGDAGADSPMETAKQSAAARKAYRGRRGAQWIQKFMRSDKYRVVPNPPNGDCLFNSIQQGLESRGRVVSVAELRSMLASAATQDLFDGYSLQYTMAKTEFDELATDTKRLTALSRTLKRRMRGADRTAQMAIAAEAEEVADSLRGAARQKEAAEEMMGEFSFMEGISNLQGMRAAIQSQEYWGDTWAVSTLERLLNVKFIIFSKRAFDDDDLDNVLLCGQNNDSVLEQRGSFEPDYYLLLGLSGTDSGNTHYELISYDGRRALDFVQLPYRVRYLVVTRCLERNAGPYSLIPDFQAALATVQPTEDGATRSSASDAGRPAGKAVFQVYGKSAGAPRPGTGTGETLGSSSSRDFADLASIQNWRRSLADDAPGPKDVRVGKCTSCFDLDGKKWATVRHYALAARYSVANPEFAARLSFDSGDKLGRDVDAATRVVRGNKPKKGDPVPPEDDPEADAQEEEAEQRARRAKFSPGTEAHRALLATKDASIRLFTRGAPARDARSLMDLRRELAEGVKEA